MTEAGTSPRASRVGILSKVAISLLPAGVFVWLLRSGSLPIVPSRAELARIAPATIPLYVAVWSAMYFVRLTRWYWLLEPVQRLDGPPARSVGERQGEAEGGSVDLEDRPRPRDGRVGRALVADGDESGDGEAVRAPHDLLGQAVEPVGAHLDGNGCDANHRHRDVSLIIGGIVATRGTSGMRTDVQLPTP